MSSALLKVPCCCLDAGGIVDPGEGQPANCNLFDTCWDGGWRPRVLGYSVSGDKLTLGLPGSLEPPVVYYFPDTTVTVQDVRVDDNWTRTVLGTQLRFRTLIEVDFSASLSCSGCTGSTSGTVSWFLDVLCQTDIYVDNNIFGLDLTGSFGGGYSNTHTFSTSCGDSQITMDDGSFDQTYIRHSEVGATGCVGLSQVELLLPIGLSLSGNGAINCSPSLPESWPNPTESLVISLSVQLMSEP